jgi:hypothetical protein
MVPKTVLEDIWVETLTKLESNPLFDAEIVGKIESSIKDGIINSDKIVDLLSE